MIRVVVDSRVRFDPAPMQAAALRDLCQEFEHSNPKFYLKKRMGLSTWNEPKLVTTWRNEPEGGGISFPRGGLAKVLKFLEEDGRDVDVVDEREGSAPARFPEFKRALREHQIAARDAAMSKEQCLIVSPAASGKTTALLAIAAEVDLPTLVILHNRTLLDQWHRRAVEEMGLRPKQVGVLRGGEKKLRPITLGMRQTVVKMVQESPELRGYFACVLADEVHLFAARTCYDCIDPMPARFRIGASDDWRRKDKMEFLISDLFGGVALDVDRDELIKKGFILDVEHVLVPTDFAAPWYGLADEDDPNDMREVDTTRLCQEMARDEERNRKAIDIIVREVSGGAQVLAMAHHREHCMVIAQTLHGMGISVGHLLGGDADRDEMQRSLRGLEDGRVRVGVGTYQAVGTGVDLPKVSVGMAITPMLSGKQFASQVRGRFARAPDGKSDARLYVMWDQQVFPTHVDNAKRWNKRVAVMCEDGSLEYLKGKPPERHQAEAQLDLLARGGTKNGKA